MAQRDRRPLHGIGPAGAGRPKKLLIALSVLFESWDGNHGGSIHCEACFYSEDEQGEICRACGGKRTIDLRGPAEENIRGDAEEVIRASAVIAQCAQHEFPRTAMEWLEQPARWIAAYEFLFPYLAIELELKHKREETI